MYFICNFDSACILFTDCKRGRLPEQLQIEDSKDKNHPGTRGVIYDLNGEVLATNKLAYSVQIEDNGSYEDTKQKNKLINKTINSVIDMVEKNGDSIVNDFGIILNSNNEYEFLYSEGTRRLRFLADIYG